MHPNGILSSLSQSLCFTLIMHSGCTNEQFSDISCDSFRKMVLEIVIFLIIIYLLLLYLFIRTDRVHKFVEVKINTI